MRFQQKTACITLVFFSFYPALAEPQSQKSQIWRVPVVSPEMPAEESSDAPAPIVAPAPARAQNFHSLTEADGEERLSAHSSLIDSSKISIFENSRSALRRAGISILGSETSTAENARLSLRASPGQAPVIYIDSVPLSSGFSGSNPENLIPALAVGQITVFPFISRGGMPRRGNSGSIDFRMRSGESKKQNEFLVSIAEPRETLFAQLYAPPCQVEALLGCLSTSRQ